MTSPDGPGEGGIIIEYLYGSGSGAEKKALLSRAGTLSNLGNNGFEIEFGEPLRAYDVESSAGGDVLTSAAQDASGAGAATAKLFLTTTYLSGTMWIVRDGDKFVVFQRTDTRSVLDRRGLVADGQLKPSEDESIRYGRLLFGESLQDYSGWEAGQNKAGTDELTQRR